MRPIASLPHPAAELARPVAEKLVPSIEWYRKFQQIVDRIPITGAATFVAGTSVVVTFVTPEISTDYLVVVESVDNRTYWVTSKLTTGFTLNASASNSDTVPWALLRT